MLIYHYFLKKNEFYLKCTSFLVTKGKQKEGCSLLTPFFYREYYTFRKANYNYFNNIINPKSYIMKTIFRIVFITAFIMMGMSTITKAQTNMNFWVYISDSCSGTWTSDYCINCYVTGGVQHYCPYSNCGYKANTWYNITYSCTINPIATDPDYGIYVSAYRDGSSSCNGYKYDCCFLYGHLSDGSKYLNPVLH